MKKIWVSLNYKKFVIGIDLFSKCYIIISNHKLAKAFEANMKDRNTTKLKEKRMKL